MCCSATRMWYADFILTGKLRKSSSANLVGEICWSSRILDYIASTVLICIFTRSTRSLFIPSVLLSTPVSILSSLFTPLGSLLKPIFSPSSFRSQVRVSFAVTLIARGPGLRHPVDKAVISHQISWEVAMTPRSGGYRST